MPLHALLLRLNSKKSQNRTISHSLISIDTSFLSVFRLTFQIQRQSINIVNENYNANLITGSIYKICSITFGGTICNFLLKVNLKTFKKYEE